MEKHENYSEYNDESKKVPWKRIFLTLLSLVVIFAIILILLRACVGKKNLEKTLLDAGKEYYTVNSNLLPTANGECKTVTLQELVDAEILTMKNYETCDAEGTYVKVCYLENNSHHYVPILACENDVSEYGLWQEGTINDLIADKSDVRFTYLGEELNKGTKYFYPDDKLESNDVIEFYATAPNDEYNNQEGEGTEAYKWYIERNTTSYWNNGAYSATQPSGYPNKGDSKTVTELSFTKPAVASYRTITETTLYRTQQMAKPFKYKCVDESTGSSAYIISDVVCEYRDAENYLDTIDIDYTCDGVNVLEDKVACGDFGKWTTTKCESSVSEGINCESKAGYSYTDKVYKWYKNEKVRQYYPSGSSSASGEKTYYVSTPINGAIKDESTKATAYKFYKLVEDTETSNFEEWVSVTDGYISETSLISKFQELEYEVNSLSDIVSIDDIRYQVKLEYRNKVSE